MKAILTSLAVLLLGFTHIQALEVGDSISCAELNTISVDGTQAQQCINQMEAGKDFLLLEFFTTWCSYCGQNLPLVHQLHEQLEARMATKLISYDYSLDDLTAYMQDNSYYFDFPVAHDPEQMTANLFGISAYPTSYLVNNEGVVVFKHIGVFDEASLMEIQSIVGQAEVANHCGAECGSDCESSCGVSCGENHCGSSCEDSCENHSCGSSCEGSCEETSCGASCESSCDESCCTNCDHGSCSDSNCSDCSSGSCSETECGTSCCHDCDEACGSSCEGSCEIAA